MRETRPSAGWKRLVFTAAHHLLVRPALSAAHYYFHGELPAAVTANFVVIAEVT